MTTKDHSLATVLARLKLRQLWQLGAAVILAIGALFGGLDTVDTKRESFHAGQPFSDGEFTLTVARATVLDEIRAGKRHVAPAEPGSRYLGVVTTIRNDGTIPGRLEDELELREPPQSQAVGVFRFADGSYMGHLGPGLTEKVAFVWKLPRSAIDPGANVTLRVWRKRFTELLVTYGRDWVNTMSYAQIDLPVGTP